MLAMVLLIWVVVVVLVLVPTAVWLHVPRELVGASTITVVPNVPR